MWAQTLRLDPYRVVDHSLSFLVYFYCVEEVLHHS